MSSFPPQGDHDKPQVSGNPPTPDDSAPTEAIEPVYVLPGDTNLVGSVPPGHYPPGQYVAGQPPHPWFPDQQPSGNLPPGEISYLPRPAPHTIRGNKPAVAMAWLAVIGIVLFIFYANLWSQLNPPETEGPTTPGELMQVNVQGKFLLGQEILLNMQAKPFEFDKPKESKDDGQVRIEKSNKDSVGTQKLNTMAALNVGPPEARYCYAILLNEFDGSQAALNQLQETDALIQRLKYKETEDQQRLREIIGSLFEQYELGDYDSRDLPEKDRQFLREKLGWSGKLALLPKNSPEVAARSDLEINARNSLIIIMGAAMLGICMLIGGMIVAVVLFALAASSQLFPRFRSQSTHGRIYIETFAIWMIGFIGLQIVVGLLSPALSAKMLMLVTATIFMASLVVLVWPVVRGIPFSEVRKDIGWKFTNPFVEGFVAVASYVALVPFMAFSILIALFIMGMMAVLQSNSGANELSSTGAVGHPIQEQIALGDPWVFLGVFFTACIAAPIVEETMFRGVLYRHLRDASSSWVRFGSVFISAMISSLIFAAIHPQGLYGIPILATLAFGFALVREWRESLIAPMLMHAINNGLVTCLLFLIV